MSEPRIFDNADDVRRELALTMGAMQEAQAVNVAARERRDVAIRWLRRHYSVTELVQLTGLSDAAIRKVCANA